MPVHADPILTGLNVAVQSVLSNAYVASIHEGEQTLSAQAAGFTLTSSTAEPGSPFAWMIPGDSIFVGDAFGEGQIDVNFAVRGSKYFQDAEFGPHDSMWLFFTLDAGQSWNNYNMAITVASVTDLDSAAIINNGQTLLLEIGYTDAGQSALNVYTDGTNSQDINIEADTDLEKVDDFGGEVQLAIVPNQQVASGTPIDNIPSAPTPEPATVLLLGSGLLAVAKRFRS